jgi:hypothetical protein
MEKPVAKKPKKSALPDKQPAASQAWLSMRTGLIALGIVSLAMTAWAAYVFIPSIGLWEGLLWAIITGGSLWLVFLIYFLFHRFVRRG